MNTKITWFGKLFSVFIVFNMNFSCSSKKIVHTKRKLNNENAAEGGSNGGGSSGGGSSGGEPIYDIADLDNFNLIISTHCTTCHGGNGSSYPNISSFKEITSLRNWIDSGYLVLGSPEQSKIYNRLIFAPQNLGTQRDMPPEATNKMTSDDADKMFSFIKGLSDPTQVGARIPLSNFSALNKIKYILHGGPFTREDLEDLKSLEDTSGSAKQTIIKKMIERWIKDDIAIKKLAEFLFISLQQDGEYSEARGEDTLIGRDFSNKFGILPQHKLFHDAVHESSRKTLQYLISNNTPFNKLLSTKKFYMTSALLAGYLFADDNRDGVRPTARNTPRFRDFLMKQVKPEDYKDWRLINFQKSSSGQFLDFDKLSDIRNLKDGSTVKLKVPRIGFFTTLGFQFKWKTNDDNRFRLTTNQTLLIMLNRSISASDKTKEFAGGSIDKEHAAESQCYACHRLLDPMKGIFEKELGFDYRLPHKKNSHDQGKNIKPGFSFMGITKSASNINGLMKLLIEHPLLAQSWVEKLCLYANSHECDVTNQEFRNIVNKFKSKFDFKQLVIDMFSSNIVLEQGKELSGKHPPTIARRTHFCSALNNRYRSMLKDFGKQSNRDDLCKDVSIVDSIRSFPEKLTIRGTPGLSMVRKNNAIFMIVKEGICKTIADKAVLKDIPSENNQSKYISSLIKYMMNMPSSHPRYKHTLDIYEDLFNNVKNLTNDSKAAMKHTFIVACGSLEMGSIGT